MVQDSPAQALGADAAGVRDVLVDVVRSRHERSAEAHQVSGSRYSMGFGGQWRDLLDDTNDAFASRGFRSHKLAPAGYQLPVVNDCLIYVWRVPGGADVSNFASSPTRGNGFTASQPQPMLLEPSFVDGREQVDEDPEEADLEHVVMEVSDKMPLVLVMVQSSPRQLQSIQWAIAVLDEAGKVQLHGQESIWVPEAAVVGEASEVESFDSGTPVAPVVELRKQEGPHSDA